MPSVDPIFSASNRSNFGLSKREFPEFFKTVPTFISSPFQSRVKAKKTQKRGGWGVKGGLMYITSIFYLLLKASLRQTIVEVEMPPFWRRVFMDFETLFIKENFFLQYCHKKMHKHLIT